MDGKTGWWFWNFSCGSLAFGSIRGKRRENGLVIWNISMDSLIRTWRCLWLTDWGWHLSLGINYIRLSSSKILEPPMLFRAMLRFGCKVTWLKQHYKRKGAKGFVCCRNYSKYQLSKYFNLKIIFSITECHDKSKKTHKRDIGHPEEGPGFEEGVWPPIAACHDKIHSPEISAFPKGLGIEERVWPRSNKWGNGRGMNGKYLKKEMSPFLLFSAW